MRNMSDCRFRHIVTDLSDCEDAIDELFNGVTDDGQPLSDDELRAARRPERLSRRARDDGPATTAARIARRRLLYGA
jgi:hypothetical protein